ncbi:aminodeoxychorismate lyase [Corynebacterium sp.]|uniref:aminodeoxychorismate lyase n=1 Tax=Corynebacterium sp. TaxID=1720 RepID=UPI0026DB5DB8|nr:aminodeoxychorismate lyase [Corynebacterium sp.]MDO5076972.1 aminodeoxychorismate lyase [Corynebacterium sp.]
MKPTIVVLEPYGGSTRHHNPELPFIFWDDAAVTRGDGIFESMLVRGGRVCNLQHHLDRFTASAELLSLPAPRPEHWLKATEEALEHWGDADGTCVWTYTRGRAATGHPSAWIVIKPIDETTLRQREHGVRVMTSPRGYSVDTQLPVGIDGVAVAPWLTIGAKTLSYAANMAAKRYAEAHGFDDVIYVEDGRVLEGTTSTVIAVRGTSLYTPPPGGDILPGTTQRALFEHARWKGWRCHEQQLAINDLLEADSVWLVSSVKIAVRVTRINEVDLPDAGDEANDRFRSMVEKALS